MDPYGSEARNGENVTLRLRILNHAPQREVYRVNWNVPAGWKMVETNQDVAIPAYKEDSTRATFTLHGEGLYVVTANIEFAGRQLREWTEAIVRVRP